MFAEILNPYLTTHNKVKKNNGEWQDLKYKKESDIYKKRLILSLKNPGDEFPIFNVKNKKVIIDQLNILNKVNSGENATQILLDSKNADENSNNIYNNQHFVLYSLDGDTFLKVPRISNYVDNHSEYLETYGNHETDNPDLYCYKLRLKKPIILSEGGRLYFKNPNDRVNFGEVEFIIKYRIIEEGV